MVSDGGLILQRGKAGLPADTGQDGDGIKAGKWKNVAKVAMVMQRIKGGGLTKNPSAPVSVVPSADWEAGGDYPDFFIECWEYATGPQIIHFN